MKFQSIFVSKLTWCTKTIHEISWMNELFVFCDVLILSLEIIFQFFHYIQFHTCGEFLNITFDKREFT